ncbi:MAG: Penicillin-binding protein 2 [Parcubacteria group bacterium GW2011_GWC2_39_14]|nr:MAG: Penicillin-binding protein 2 [Parcubacteria group bacterium GW2011_GWC2_39_14]KKR55373.1 MAG: Penicillin-binding protein 2 [Parcubacteria group bacterium GW2011_GWA2_40_23]
MWSYLKYKFTNKLKKKYQDDSAIFAGSKTHIESSGIKSRNKSAWVEEAFVNYTEEDLVSTKQNYLGTVLPAKRMIIFWFCLMLGVVLLLARALQLQVIKGPYYRSVAEKNRIRVYNLPAPRGIIYDINNIPLVRNVPTFALYIIPNDLSSSLENKDEVLTWLNKNLKMDSNNEDLQKILKIKSSQKEYYEPVLLVEDIDYEAALKMHIESAIYNGVDVEIQSRREYLNTNNQQLVSSLAHVLGYEGKISQEEYENRVNDGYLFNDFIGKTGLEESLEKTLRGVYGKEQVEVDSSGKAIKILAQEDVKKGDNVILNIDFEMQKKLESITQAYLNKYNKQKSAIVVLNPQNGAVMVLLSLPGYDNNAFSKGISGTEYNKLMEDKNKPLFNRVISGEYPSGSTIKPVMAASALEEGIITASTSFLSTGGIRIGQWFFPDWLAGGHGITDVKKALAQSVNTFFYIIGGGYGEQPGLGVYKIKEYLEKFGLYKVSGIELPNEHAGFLPTPEWKEKAKNEPWYIGDTYHLSIGQGDLLVTPLQIANYTGVFANKGTLYKPHLVNHYFDQNTQQTLMIEPEVINSNFIKENNIEIVRQGMQQGVKNGSSRILNSLPVTSGAKTGTAQWNLEKDPHAWFTAFAPYNDAEIVITVLVEEGKEGSQISAYIANDFLNWYFREYHKLSR